MYKLLLVDDERDILDGLMEIVPFEKLGFTVLGTASNGAEGVQAAERLSPDLVITDIRMPLMDGLSMCAEIARFLPACRFTVLSGYDDFDYARRAIDAGATAYLLKPISSEEFIRMLGDMKKLLDEDFSRRRDLVRLQKHYENSLPLLKEMLLASCMSGGAAPEDALNAARGYGMRLLSPMYAAALLRVAAPAGADGRLLPLAVMELLRDSLSPAFDAHVFHFDGMPAVLFLLDGGGDARQERMLEALREARLKARKYLDCDLRVGLSAAGSDLGRLPTLAQQALSALQQTTMGDGGEVLCVTDLEPGSSRAASPDEQALRRLTGILRIGGKSEIPSAVAALTDACTRLSLTLKGYRAYLMEILMALFQIIRDMDLDDAGFDRALSLLTRCPPPDEARLVLEELCVKIASDILGTRADTGSRIAGEAREMAQQSFSDETLGTEQLCARLHVSSSYFSMIFKKETGKTFHQYLTDLRMEQAMTLLAQGEMRTGEVARAVGIPDPSYFSFVFKKHFGLSPSQVKKKEGAP